MPGTHNVLNALAAAAVARRVGASDDAIKSGFGNFKGVKRRFTHVGDWKGAAIIDDYGHHPEEIAAVLRAARNVAKGKIIAVVQPHRYSRVQNLFDDFCACMNEADIALITDIYPAGEVPIEGVDRDALIAGVVEHGHRDVRALESFEVLPKTIADIAEPGDYIVCLGAGDITRHANSLVEKLGALS